MERRFHCRRTAGRFAAEFGRGMKRNSDGTKVTLPMGSADGARLGVPSGVRTAETIAVRNELKQEKKSGRVPGLG